MPKRVLPLLRGQFVANSETHVVQLVHPDRDLLQVIVLFLTKLLIHTN